MAIGRTNAGGSGAGGTLSVTGVAGSTVTVSNSDKSYTRTLGSDGKATFKGLASGTWTVTMTDGTQTATREVTVTADYAATITYFAATINVTYPAGSTCTMTNGTTTLTAPDATGTWACIVPNAGTWTVTITDGTDTATDSVSITTDGQTVSVTMLYELKLFPTSSPTSIWGSKVTSRYPAIVNIGATSMTVKGIAGSNDDGGVVTTSKYDLSKFSKIRAKVSTTTVIAGTQLLFVTSGGDWAWSGMVSSVNLPAGATDKICELDIASIDTSLYIAIGAISTGGYTYQTTITEVTLIP